MFEENYDYLLDNLYSQLESLYPEDMLRDLDVSLEDYDIEWPQDLIADVLNDDFTDWDKLEAELEQAQREADEDMERFKREKNSEPTDIDFALLIAIHLRRNTSRLLALMCHGYSSLGVSNDLIRLSISLFTRVKLRLSMISLSRALLKV